MLQILSVQSRSDGVNTSLFEKREHIEKLHRTRNLLRKIQVFKWVTHLFILCQWEFMINFAWIFLFFWYLEEQSYAQIIFFSIRTCAWAVKVKNLTELLKRRDFRSKKKKEKRKKRRNFSSPRHSSLCLKEEVSVNSPLLSSGSFVLSLWHLSLAL